VTSEDNISGGYTPASQAVFRLEASLKAAMPSAIGSRMIE